MKTTAPGLGRDVLPGDVQTLSPIQVIPQGLMGFLQLKQTGRLPAHLGGTVGPVIEMRDWYFQSRRVTEFSLFGAVPTTVNVVTGNTGVLLFSVPATVQPARGTVWYVEQYTVTISGAAAADTFVFSPGIFSPSGIGRQLGPTVGPNTPTANTQALYASANRGFWVQSEDQLCVLVNAVTTAGAPFKAQFAATVLQV